MLTGLQATSLSNSGIEGMYQVCAVCCISLPHAQCVNQCPWFTAFQIPNSIDLPTLYWHVRWGCHSH